MKKDLPLRRQTMLAKRIIPCLDIDKGRVVKGIKFLNTKDAGDPVIMAKYYNKEGADELVFLDITASQEQRNMMIDVVRRVAKQVYIPFTVGGGIKTLEDIKNILRAGADKVAINTTAVKNPQILIDAANTFGSQCVVLAIDAKKMKDSWEVYIYGGKVATGIDSVEWVKDAAKKGVGEILLTSIDKDGTKDGYDNALTKKISENVSVPIIASGGAGSLKDFADIFSKGKADAALAASLFHFGELKIKNVKDFLKKKKIPVRII